MTSINWFIPIYILAIYGSVHYFMRSKGEQPKGAVNWTPWESAGVTVAIYFAAQLLGGAIVYVIPLLRGWSQAHINTWLESSPAGQFLLIALVETATLWLLYMFLKRRSATPATIGLGRRPKWSDAGYVFIGFAGYFILYLLITNALASLLPHLDTNQQQQVGFETARHMQLIFVFLSLVVLPPFVEEILVRGFLYSGLKKGMPVIWAALITSTLFGMAHLQAGEGTPLLWIAAVDTFTLSLVLVYLREKTGSLWAGIGLHMLKNFVAFLSLFIFHLV